MNEDHCDTSRSSTNRTKWVFLRAVDCTLLPTFTCSLATEPLESNAATQIVKQVFVKRSVASNMVDPEYFCMISCITSCSSMSQQIVRLCKVIQKTEITKCMKSLEFV